MAVLRLDHTPESVKLNQPLYLILPDPGRMNGRPLRERRVLYLLHGLSDDASAWQRFTAVETYAAAYDLAVVMPSAGRSFYADQPNGQAYFTYLTEELPRYLEQVFGLAPRREDCFIAGNSMGGYGAMKAALLHPGSFAAAASFSGFLSLEFLRLYPDDPRQEEFRHLFGDLNLLSGSPHDPAIWLQQAAARQADLPRLMVSCGRQDDLYLLTGIFMAQAKQAGVAVEYHEEDARHDWLFWDKELRRFLLEILGQPARQPES